ncbi:hypothetical protein [Paenibacillus sedimenti]|uniref:Uncharacterized protein n=1 Tax=Paenibacillus sedimenti TaxID=2770274 RepID=A0A926QI31_9BACL|nr:hypothetical protein [Paenibacillus sedimenti]MBD0379149.1 hypothetical protein [Paenibacillus sedimenti]
MTKYWLTPIIHKFPLQFGADRVCCEPLHELDSFREAAHKLHPRLLPMFKASLLLSDDEELCGSELIELDLSDVYEIVFDGRPYHLSHCAEAFLDRILNPQEVLQLVSTMDDNNSELSSDKQLLWKQLWLDWLKSGWDVILLREDGV